MSRLPWVLVAFLCLAGCKSATIQQVTAPTPEGLAFGVESRPVQLKRVVVKVPRSESIGSIATGIFCIPNQQLTAQGGRSAVDDENFQDAFRDEFEDANFTVAGDGHGSGFAISSDGYILTDSHVVENANFVTVRFVDDTETVGAVVRSDRRRDVALIKIDKPTHALPVRAERPSLGDDVYAVGSPFDVKLSATVSRGVVSGFRDEDGYAFIQSDADVHPGNSGGPLVDRNGNVVGIAVSVVSIGGATVGLNFFIPVADAIAALGLVIEPQPTS